MSGDFLATMAELSRARVARARTALAPSELRARARAAPEPPRLTLTGGFDLIAEVKLRSPAVGQLRSADDDIAARVTDYAAGGAAAISVLTEPTRFDGSLEHLARATQALGSRVPAMRKDFLVDPYQLYEARLAGAGGALVILRMLTRAQIEALLETASELRQFILLEAFDAADLELADSLFDQYGRQATLLVGVNCRDLTSLQVVPGRLEALASLLPAGAPRVAESGIMTPADAAQLVTAGYNLALVGSALMQTATPAALLRAMLAAGRAAAGQRACG
jgi:indole-3-glycerol phosphate synthase